MINSIPSRLHVTYGALVYRTMVPLFATTTVLPFEEIANVHLTSSYGIRVVSVELQPAAHTKRGTAVIIATGLEVDLLYQLLMELLNMHKQERARRASLQTEEQDAVLLKTLLDYDDEGEEEHKTSE